MQKNCVSIPPNHPLSVTLDDKKMLEQADVILALDTVDLSSILRVWSSATGQTHSLLSPKTRIVQISQGQLFVGGLSCDSGGVEAIDIDIVADTSLALPQLAQMCRDLIGQDAAKLERYRHRFGIVRETHDRARSHHREQADKKRNDIPISQSRLVDDLMAVIKNENWVLVGNRSHGTPQKLWDWTDASQSLGWSGGGGMGYALSGALGATLAYKGTDKLCVNLQSDGDFLMTPSALWTAVHYRIPLLTIMLNNRTFYSSEYKSEELAKVRGRPGPAQNKGIGHRLDYPSVNYAKLAQSYDVYGEGPIENPENLRPALERAVKMVKESKAPALVDVIVQPR